MTEQDLREELKDLKEELRKVRIERTQLRRQVDDLTQGNVTLRKLNAEYTQLLADRPVTRSKLQETIRLQADQIAALQHHLKVASITDQYSKTDDKRVHELENKVQALETENATLKEELQKYTFTAQDLTPARRGRPRSIPESKRQQVKALKAQGCSIRRIAELLNVSTGFVHKVLKA